MGVLERRQRLARGHFHRLRENVPRHLERHRTAPAAHHLLEGAGNELGGLRRVFDARGPFGEAGEGCELIGHLVQLAASAIEKGPRHLPGDAQHR